MRDSSGSLCCSSSTEGREESSIATKGTVTTETSNH